MARFDKFVAEQNTPILTNGHSSPPKPAGPKSPELQVPKTEALQNGILKTEESHSETLKDPIINPVKVEAPISPKLAISAPKTTQATPNGKKRRSDDDDDDDELSDVPDSPPPKKKRKEKPAVDDDAAFAAKLQAEENSRARPTRGGATRKAAPVKKKRVVKKKTKDKVRPEDDSDLEGSDASKEKNVKRNGAFHVSSI